MECLHQNAANAADSTEHDVDLYQNPLHGEDTQTIVAMFISALEKECRNGGKVSLSSRFFLFESDNTVLICGLLQLISSKSSNFHSARVPDISVEDKLSDQMNNSVTVLVAQIAAYVSRIADLCNCSSSCFIVAWRYLKQLEKKDSKFALNKLNVHRLVITTMMVASKFIDDKNYSNQYWAGVRLHLSCADSIRFADPALYRRLAASQNLSSTRSRLSSSSISRSGCTSRGQNTWSYYPISSCGTARRPRPNRFARKARSWTACAESTILDEAGPCSQDPSHPCSSPSQRAALL